MNKEIQVDWITNLTNGEYMQGVGELRTKNDEYCCLGVLCDRAVKAGIAKWVYQEAAGWFVIPRDMTMETARVAGAVGSATLPAFIVRWAGLESHNPAVLINDEHTALSRANDSLQITFAEIAERVREDL